MRFPKSRTSLDMDGTLYFDCYRLSVNFSHMSPKLVRTYPHIVENQGITMAPLQKHNIFQDGQKS